MNVPYKKEYNEAGELVNGFKDSYYTPYPNRKTRRKREGRFNSNRKGVNIVTVLGRVYKKILQKVDNKYIYHYKPIYK
jgi:hypothetical protein